MSSSNDKKKVIFTCSNCGRSGHNFRHCRDPITSYGIVLVRNINNNVSSDPLMFKNPEMVQISNLINNIEFLLVSRKNSLGYIEFMRGRYKPDNIDQITYLLKQMTPDEIEMLKTKSFETLWDELWLDKVSKKFVKDEYDLVAEKYNAICNNQISLRFLLENVKPTFTTPEWGFPKGRKNVQESNKECAVREFTEETSYTADDIEVLDATPFVENLTGTNGIKYRHIYYLAILKTDRAPTIDPLSHQRYEIGGINFFNYYDTLTVIRDYHTEKKNVVKDVLCYFISESLKKN